MTRKFFTECWKKISIWFVVLSALLSVMLVVSRHIFYNSSGNSTVDTTFVTDFHIFDFIAIVVLIPLIYLIIKAAAFLLDAVSNVFFAEKRKPNLWVFLGIFLLLMVFWFPYLPSYWPGGIYADTVDSINMALGKAALDNHNPILYTMIWRFMFWITGAFSGAGEYGGLKLFTVVQMVLLSLVMTGFIYWCYRKGIHIIFILFMTLFAGVFSLYPFYGISLWKDTIFSLVVFGFSIFLYHVFADLEDNISWKQLGLYCLFSVLIIFLRNNGIYIAAFYAIIIVLVCLKNHKMTSKRIGIASLVVIVLSGIVQGPVFDKCGYNIDRSVESFGIPIQQVAYIVATDGVVDGDDMEVLNEIMPIENWKALYNPIVADTIKFDPSFNKEFFEENTNEFVQVYVNVILHNPVKAVKAYMLATMGFWNIFENSSTAYICNFHFGNVEYFMSDYFEYYTQTSFRDLVEPKDYISPAVFAWTMLATVCICLAKRNYKGLIPILPTLGLWLSIMVATPVAFSLRYVYALFLCVPLYIISSIRSFCKN